MRLNLFCAVVGPTRNVFEVEIDDATTVSKLKEAVVDQSGGAITAPYPNLQLFLAKKDGAWLKDDDDLDAVLQSGDATAYDRMLATSKLNDSKLFGSDVSRGEGVIHVLVVLPSEMVITPSRDPGRIVTLFCAIIGTAESAFPVDIGENMSVGHLKDAIWTKQQYQFSAAKLHLFMAKKNNKWLDAAGAAALSLDIHGRPQGYAELMNPLLPLKDDKHFGAGFQPGVGQVQVLVVLPSGIAIDIGEGEGNMELQLYQERGESIRDNCGDCCTEILDKIDALYKLDPKIPLPFVCVEGSSGMGKSQLAFALEGSRPWFYWPVASFGVNTQHIYSNFKSLSSAFKKVTRDDKPMNKTEDDILNCRSRFYKEESLWAYGFILVLLKYSCLEGSRAGEMLRIEDKMLLYVEKCNLAAVADFRDRMKAEGKLLPFFVLDEMTPSAGDAKLAAFQRNVFRACGLVVVVMGTDSKITNLFMDEEKQVTWDQMQTQYPVLKLIVESSRGRFSRFFAASVVEYAANTKSVNLCDLLDEAFSEVHRRTIEGKNCMRKENGPAAQLKVISYSIAVEGPGMKRRASDGGEDRFVKRRKLAVRSDYMHVHFANLIDEQPSNIDVVHGSLYRKKEGWSPQCRFPTIEEDLLLYLAVLGGKKYSAYFGANITFSVFQVFSSHLRGRFKLYEEMVAQMIFCASRRNGVRGIQCKDFLPCLLQEFQEETESKPMTVDGEEKTIREILQGYSDFSEFLATTVPFLAPPNAQWPQYLLDTRDLGCNFGHLVRTKNQQRRGLCVYEVGVSGTPLFLCECNYQDKTLDMGTMTAMIDGLDSVWKGENEWKIVLLFCVKLAKIQKTSWNRRAVGCVKIDCRGKESCRVEWVFQPVEGSRQKLIIALETGASNVNTAA